MTKRSPDEGSDRLRLADLWLLPNLLSLLRLLCALPLFLLLRQPRPPLWPVLGVACIIILSDFFDGWIARKLDLKSELGRVLDPLADKVILFSVLIALLAAERLPLFLFFFLIGKDVVILVGGLLVSLRRGTMVSSNIYGKWASTLLAFGFLPFILLPSLHQANLPLLQPLIMATRILIGLGIGAVFLSLGSYGAVLVDELSGTSNRSRERIFLIVSGIAAVFFIILLYVPFSRTNIV